MQAFEIQVALCMKLNLKCQIHNNKSELENHDSFQYVYMEFEIEVCRLSIAKRSTGMYSRPKKTIQRSTECIFMATFEDL